MAKYEINEDQLHEFYLKQNLSITDIANKIGCSRNNVFYYLNKYKIERRKRTSANFKNLVDSKYGMLLVKQRDFSRKNVYWVCICDCGQTTSVRASHLVGGKIKSCGCNQFLNHWKGFGEISGEKWKSIKTTAENRNLDFNITIEYAWNLFLKQDRKCALSGTELFFSTWWKGEQTASLDRIDSKLGYVEGNVQWIHKIINRMKGKMRDKDLIHWCSLITNHNTNPDPKLS